MHNEQVNLNNDENLICPEQKKSLAVWLVLSLLLNFVLVLILVLNYLNDDKSLIKIEQSSRHVAHLLAKQNKHKGSASLAEPLDESWQNKSNSPLLELVGLSPAKSKALANHICYNKATNSLENCPVNSAVR